MSDEQQGKQEERARSQDIRETIERLQRIDERKQELAKRVGPALVHHKTTPEPKA